MEGGRRTFKSKQAWIRVNQWESISLEVAEAVLAVLLDLEAQVADALLPVPEHFEAVDVVLLRGAVHVDAVALLLGRARRHPLAVHADLLDRVPQARVLHAAQLAVHLVPPEPPVLVLLRIHNQIITTDIMHPLCPRGRPQLFAGHVLFIQPRPLARGETARRPMQAAVIAAAICEGLAEPDRDYTGLLQKRGYCILLDFSSLQLKQIMQRRCEQIIRAYPGRVWGLAGLNKRITSLTNYQFNLMIKWAIINHTMLQNSALGYAPPALPDCSSPAAQLLLLQTLIQEIEQHKRSLSQALSINGLLVQEASAAAAPAPAAPTDACSNDLPAHALVKLEDSAPAHSASVEVRARKQQKRSKNEEEEETHDKNETKNIPKNYGKAILSFIQKNIQKYLSIIKPILGRGKLSINDLLLHIKRHKKEVNSINYLKEMWGYQDHHNPILKCIRVLSYVFMRKHCLAYIFNSRVKNYSTHIKYRTRIIEGIQHPEEFTCIKQF